MAEEARSPDPEELKDAFKRAAEIAAVVPEAMQEAAFHRALDQILGAGEPAVTPRTNGSARPDRQAGKDTPADHAQQLVDGINRTDYPEIPTAAKVLDRGLAVLRLASRDFDIDGLTAPEIARVLTEKFRQRTSRQAVAQALGGAHAMVDTSKRGQKTIYRIMQAGEDYLERGGSQEQNATTSEATSTPRRRRKPARRARTRPTASVQKPASTRATRRRGPKTALGELIDEGYFSQARTINDAQEHLRHKKGLRFTLQDLSPSLVRLLRDGRLDRDRNASGHYEYRSK